MKKLFYLMMIALLSSAVFISCNDDDDDDTSNPPEFAGANLSGDNMTVTVTFTQGVYGDEAATEPLTANSFAVVLAGGTAVMDGITVEHTAGAEIAEIMINYTEPANGEEVITVEPLFIYNSEGVAMSTDQMATVQLAELGIIGEWYSSGNNVAPLLATYFNVDSIYADFNSDQTYVVESYDPDGVKTEYTGTYTQTKSDVGNIYTILLNQSTPSSITSEGIFEVVPNGDGFDLKYEVVQTEPDIGNTPPTPTGGFGSSNNGELGDSNIQKFLILN